MMCTPAHEVDDDLDIRVGGRRFLEPMDLLPNETDAAERDEDDAVDSIHPAMLTLLQLDAERPGSIKPRLAARGVTTTRTCY